MATAVQFLAPNVDGKTVPRPPHASANPAERAQQKRMTSRSSNGARRKARAGAGWVLTVLLLTTAGPARADDPKQEAKARYETAQSHYNLNEFQEALQDFKEGYRLFPDPVFLFNLAQCERQLGNVEEAIKFYRSYLRNRPKAPNRQEVVRRIDEMQAAIDAKKVAAGLAPPAAASESHPPAHAELAPAPPAAAAPAPIAMPISAPTATATLPTPPRPVAFAPSVATPTGTRSDLAAQSASPAPLEAPKFYQRWWFWTAGAVVLAGVGIGVYAATARGSSRAPSSALGTQSVF